MSSRELHNVGLHTDWDLGEDGWKAGMDRNLLRLDTLVQARVLGVGENSPPPSPSEGDVYIVGESPTGVWSEYPHHVAVRDDDDWAFIPPGVEWTVRNIGDGRGYRFTGTRWVNDSTFVTSLPDITALSSLDPEALVDGQQFSVGSYLPNTSTGSCLLRWRPDLPKSRHDGVLFFSLTVPMFTGTDTADYRNGVGETDPSGNGVMELVRGEIIYDHIALIPSVYASMPEVVESTFQRVRPAANSRIRIRFESGHQPTLGLSTEDGDYSKYIIESEDPSVTLAAGFSGVSVESTQSNAFIAGRNARMPELGCLVDALDRCDVGYLVFGTSSGYVSPGCGVERSAVFGFYVVNDSELSAPMTRWKEAGRGNRITTASKGHLEGADMSGARALGFSPEATFGLDISRGSVVNIMSQGVNVTDVSGSAGRGLTCRRSKVSGDGLRSGNCALEGVRLELGTEATLANLQSNDNGGDGIFVTSGSSLSGQGIEALRNVGYGARFLNGSRGDMTASVIEDTDGVGLLIAHGSSVNFRDCEVRRSTGNNIQLDDGSEINGVRATSEDAGVRGVAMNGGCSGNFRDATITGSANQDIRISRGCWVAASDCTTTSGPISTADTNLSAFNTLSDNGVIFA